MGSVVQNLHLPRQRIVGCTRFEDLFERSTGVSFEGTIDERTDGGHDLIRITVGSLLEHLYEVMRLATAGLVLAATARDVLYLVLDDLECLEDDVPIAVDERGAESDHSSQTILVSCWAR